MVLSFLNVREGRCGEHRRWTGHWTFWSSSQSLATSVAPFDDSSCYTTNKCCIGLSVFVRGPFDVVEFPFAR